MRDIRIITTVILLLTLSACGGKRPVGVPHPGANATDAQICRDLALLPQDLRVYADKAGADKLLLAVEEQEKEAARAKDRMFRAWRMSGPSKWVKKNLEDNFDLKPDAAFGENLRPFAPEDWAALVANADVKNFPARVEKAITVRHTDLRAMPTARPFFLNPDRAGEGYPFDYFQQTSLPVGTPVFVCHVSADGQWVLVETALSAGWLAARDVGAVDDDFARHWQSLPLAALARDDVLLWSGGDDQVTGKPESTRGHIGALLPQAHQDAGREAHVVLVPRRSADGRARATRVTLPGGAALSVPVPLTPANLASVGNEMMGQPYGWGGLFERRDCSALTRDLLAPFGIWLPRNSAAQGSWGRAVSLTGLSAEEKEARVQAEALPFFSLLWMRGHITLYLGVYEGEAVMFHNIWGLRVRKGRNDDDDALSRAADVAGAGGREGRVVIGKAVVTTLRPGAELPGISTPNSLLDRIERISVLPEAEEKTPVIKKARKKAAKKFNTTARKKSGTNGKKKRG